DQASRDIVRSIVELCRNLKLPCIIEGVETIEQVIILRSIGCMIMQGFYFGRPISNDDVLVELAEAQDIVPVSCEDLVGMPADRVAV
ncbi:MAG: EAL domain-containing protein, partial [Beijerinckiaceae bacterium]|nr:EAL domain-containing protein [Beijerinckiaceae bacterium]